MLVYVSAWLKCHEPAAFSCALLNSQPMGFYAPAQLVRDAREHGVEVRPVDVGQSEWDSTLERRADGGRRCGSACGWSRVWRASGRCASSRRARRVLFESVQRSQPPCGLGAKDLGALAAAGALARRWRVHRHLAFWEVAGVNCRPHCSSRPRFNEALPLLRRPPRARTSPPTTVTGPHPGPPSAGAAARPAAGLADQHGVRAGGARRTEPRCERRASSPRASGRRARGRHVRDAGGRDRLSESRGLGQACSARRAKRCSVRLTGSAREVAEGRGGHARGCRAAVRSHALLGTLVTRSRDFH